MGASTPHFALQLRNRIAQADPRPAGRTTRPASRASGRSRGSRSSASRARSAASAGEEGLPPLRSVGRRARAGVREGTCTLSPLSGPLRADRRSHGTGLESQGLVLATAPSRSDEGAVARRGRTVRYQRASRARRRAGLTQRRAARPGRGSCSSRVARIRFSEAPPVPGQWTAMSRRVKEPARRPPEHAPHPDGLRRSRGRVDRGPTARERGAGLVPRGRGRDAPLRSAQAHG